MAWINEIYDLLFDPDTICVAFVSYGKDSLAMLRAIKLLGLPLHRIVHSEVWATETIPADLPPMVEFKRHADKIIKDLYGIEVEHICATRPCSQNNNVERERERESYESMFYRRLQSGKFAGAIKGFPQTNGSWCKKLKTTGEADVRRYLLSEIQEPEGRKEGRKEICMGSQPNGALGATASSRSESPTGIYGYPTRGNEWCHELKQRSLRISHLDQSGAMVPTTQALFRKPPVEGR